MGLSTAPAENQQNAEYKTRMLDPVAGSPVTVEKGERAASASHTLALVFDSLLSEKSDPLRPLDFSTVPPAASAADDFEAALNSTTGLELWGVYHWFLPGQLRLIAESHSPQSTAVWTTSYVLDASG